MNSSMASEIKGLTSNKIVQLIAVFTLCLCVRTAVAFALDNVFDVDREVDVYATLAKNIAAGHGFVLEPDGAPVVWRAPLYPIFLATIYKFFGDEEFVSVLIFQLIFDAISATLIYLLCSMTFNKRTALIAAVAFSAYPVSVYYTLRLLPESAFTMALTAMTVAMSMSIRKKSTAWFAVTGIVAGVAILVKPVALTVLLFAACALVVFLQTNVGTRIRATGIVLAAAIFVVAPWTARNYHETGMLVPVATGGGYALWYGNNLVSDGLEDFQLEGPVLNDYVRARQSILAPYHPEMAEALRNEKLIFSMASQSQTTAVRISPEADRAFFKAGVEGILLHPLQTSWLMVKKMVRLWFAIFFPGNRWAQIPIAISQLILLGLATFGVYCSLVNGHSIFAPLTVVAGLSITHVVFNATLRYSVPLLPIVFMLASYGLVEFFRRISTTRVSDRAR
jgi:4-amino-4-deoxy-L-arabinose transferase-like glycosyltransferase